MNTKGFDIKKLFDKMRPLAYSIMFLLLLMSGCTSQQIKKEPGAKGLYDKALGEMKGGVFGPDYEEIRQTLNQIVDNYPYSTYAPLAQLRIADTYFKQSRYLESAEAYNHFIKMYPNDKEVPYAVFKEGKSYLENQKTWLFRTIPYDIDETGIYNALDEFNYIVNYYPSSKYFKDAQRYAKLCNYTLARHDLYIADFYIAHDHYEAAIDRLKEIPELYPTSGLVEQALKKLAYLYKKINSLQEYNKTVKLLKQNH